MTIVVAVRDLRFSIFINNRCAAVKEDFDGIILCIVYFHVFLYIISLTYASGTEERKSSDWFGWIRHASSGTLNCFGNNLNKEQVRVRRKRKRRD